MALLHTYGFKVRSQLSVKAAAVAAWAVHGGETYIGGDLLESVEGDGLMLCQYIPRRNCSISGSRTGVAILKVGAESIVGVGVRRCVGISLHGR